MTPQAPSVRMFMDRRTHALRDCDRVLEAATWLIRRGVTGAPVVNEDGQVIGMITERELLRLLTVGGPDGDVPHGTVQDYLIEDAITVDPDMDIFFCAGIFNGNSTVRRLAVVEDDKLVGVITRKDLLRAVEARLRRTLQTAQTG